MNITEPLSSQEAAIKHVTIEQAVENAAAILKRAGAKEVYLFGSTAEGQFRPHSDIDLAVTGLPSERFFQAMGEVLLAVPRPVDLIDLDTDTPFTRYLIQNEKLCRVA